MKGEEARVNAYVMRTRGRGFGTSKHALVPFRTYFVIMSYAKYFYHTLMCSAMAFITTYRLLPFTMVIIPSLKCS